MDPQLSQTGTNVIFLNQVQFLKHQTTIFAWNYSDGINIELMWEGWVMYLTFSLKLHRSFVKPGRRYHFPGCLLVALDFWETGWRFKRIKSVAQSFVSEPKYIPTQQSGLHMEPGSRLMFVPKKYSVPGVWKQHTHSFLHQVNMFLHRFFTWWIRWTFPAGLDQWRLLRKWWVGIMHFCKC